MPESTLDPGGSSDKSAGAAPAAPTPTEASTSSPEHAAARLAAEAIVARLNAGDLEGVKALTCQAGQQPGTNGVPLVAQDIVEQIPPFNPDRTELASVKTTFTLKGIQPVDGQQDVAALVKVGFANVPTAAIADPKLVEHTGAMRMRQEAGRWVTCGMRLGPTTATKAPTAAPPPR